MTFLIGGANSAVSGYDIENSLRFGGDNHHLSMVYGSSASDANRRTWTFSGWIKLGQAAHYSLAYPNEKYILTSTDAAVSTTHIGYGYTAGDFFLGDGRSATYIYTTEKFRDPSAWYHLVVKYDSTQGTASNRIFIYVNGVAQTLNYSNTGDPEVDLNTAVDFFLAGDNVDVTSADSGNFVHNVNSYYNSLGTTANSEFDGYIADFYLLDGQALAPTEFAETNDNGVWVPKKYTGTFNSHSFFLEFQQTGSSANSSGIGADTSGQDNHFKVGVNSTLAATDVTVDTPTNNFCTLNPLANSSYTTLSEGNLKTTGNSATNNGNTEATMAVANGKWYWEHKMTTSASPYYPTTGALKPETVGRLLNGGTNAMVGVVTDSVGYEFDGDRRISNTSTDDHFASLSNGDILGIALDMDNGAVYFSKAGTWENSSDPESGASKTNAAHTWTADGRYMMPATASYNGSVAEINFGNPSYANSSSVADANGYGAFEYAVPSGYYALCTKNLAEYG